MPSKASSDEITDLISYQMEISDDGKSALVEFVVANLESLKPLLESKDAGVKSFVRGRAKKEDIEAEFKKYKQSFTADKFVGGAR